MSYTPKTKPLYKRFAIGYSGILGMVLAALGFSIAQGAGWKPVLVGLPVYLTFFVVGWGRVRLKRMKRRWDKNKKMKVSQSSMKNKLL
jgi:hypothetical protein